MYCMYVYMLLLYGGLKKSNRAGCVWGGKEGKKKKRKKKKPSLDIFVGTAKCLEFLIL